MLNYPIEPSVLRHIVPRGTELDTWQGRHYISVVGFLFERTRVFGVPVPFHRNFEEVNLRYYVRRKASDGWRRGVAFIKEVVPRSAMAALARWVYNENYIACPMSSLVHLPDLAAGVNGRVDYCWKPESRKYSMSAEFQHEPDLPAEGSEEEFITEHYWGYVGQRNGSTLEYRVEHLRWRGWRGLKAKLDCDVASFYGDQYCEALGQPPTSAFIAEGSPVAVFKGEAVNP